MEFLSLQGKIAMVTGAGSGIGEATARRLAERGASVALVDIQQEAVEKLAAELGGPKRAVAVSADLSAEENIARAVAETVDAFGGVDILHNNAALLAPEAFVGDQWITDIDVKLFESILRVNLIAPMLATKHAVPHMISRGGGVIVNTASMSGKISDLFMPMYGASKAGLIGMTRNIATQYSAKGIRAVGINPAGVVTEKTRAAAPERIAQFQRHVLTPRLGEPDDVANLVAFLVSDQASYITGVTIDVDGGFSAHFPTYADEREAAEAQV